MKMQRIISVEQPKKQTKNAKFQRFIRKENTINLNETTPVMEFKKETIKKKNYRDSTENFRDSTKKETKNKARIE